MCSASLGPLRPAPLRRYPSLIGRRLGSSGSNTTMKRSSNFRVLIHDLPADHGDGSRFRLGLRNILILGEISAQAHVTALASLLYASEPGDAMLGRSWCVTVIDVSQCRVDRAVRIRLGAMIARAIDTGEALFVLVGFNDSLSHWIERWLRVRSTPVQYQPLFL